MTEEETEKDESNERPKTIGDLRREAVESPRSEEAKAVLKELMDSMDRIEEWSKSVGDDQRRRLAQFAEEIQSPLFGVDHANAEHLMEAERKRRMPEFISDLTSRPVPSPEVMALGKLSRRLDEMVQITKAALASEEEARRSEGKWRAITIAITLFGILIAIVNIVVVWYR